MNMRGYRLVRIASFYPGAIRDFYAKFPREDGLSLAEDSQRFFQQGYGWSDFYERQLEKLGHDASVIAYGVDRFQRQWQRENGCEGLDRFSALLLQLKGRAPDVLLIEDLSMFTKDQLGSLRAAVPSLRLVLCSHCCPTTADHLAKMTAVDLVLTCCPGIMSQIAAAGIPVTYQPHAFATPILERIGPQAEPPLGGISFVGSIIAGKGYHHGRNEILTALGNGAVDLTVYGDLVLPRHRFVPLKRFAKSLAAAGTRLDITGQSRKIPLVQTALAWEEPESMHIDPSVQERLHAPVFGLAMYQALRRHRLTFNSHGDVTRYAANMRLFEATGVGACLVTDHMVNIGDFFAPDTEVVTYKSKEECVEKVKWLLAHPAEAEAVGKAGQAKCVGTHSVEVRARQLDETIRRGLG